MNDLKLGCLDATFPRISHEGSLALIAELGLTHVDVCVWAEGLSHLVPADLLVDAEGAAAKVGRAVAAAGLQVSDVFMHSDHRPINHPDPGERDIARSEYDGLLRFASAVGSPQLTVLPGRLFPERSRADDTTLAVEELAWRKAQADAAGVQLAWEPVTNSPGDDIARTQALLAAVPGTTLTLDWAHFEALGIPQPDVDVLLPATSHLHARQARLGQLQVNDRLGTIDFERIVGSLSASPFDGVVTIEYFWDPYFEDCDLVDCVSETAVLRDRLRRALA